MDGLWRDDPWLVDPAAFVRCDDDLARLRFLVTFAVLAPSGHNSQPWQFRLRRDGALELRADRSRALPVVDPADRALTISCGAALANLRAAAATLGEALDVAVLPDPAAPDLLALIMPRGPAPPRTAGALLLRAMTARRTSRFGFARDPVPAELRDEAIAAAEQAGDVRLHWIEDATLRHAVALLVSEGDRTQMADPAFRRELAHWMRPRDSMTRDGISAAAFGKPDMLTAVTAFVVRTFDLGAGQAARDLALAEGSPALALFATEGDAPRDWMAAGEALQRTLLVLTAGGFTASFLNQPIEVAALRPHLAAITGARNPQVLLRIGRGTKPVAAPRRPVRDVLWEA